MSVLKALAVSTIKGAAMRKTSLPLSLARKRMVLSSISLAVRSLVYTVKVKLGLAIFWLRTMYSLTSSGSIKYRKSTPGATFLNSTCEESLGRAFLCSLAESPAGTLDKLVLATAVPARSRPQASS